MKSLEPRHTGLSEFAYGTIARPGAGDWSVLAVSDESPALVGEDLTEELRALGATEVRCIDVAGSAADIARQFEQSPTGILVAREIDPLPEALLQDLDYARSRLVRDDAVVLVLRLSTFKTLLRVAPNLASFVEGCVALLAPQLEQLGPDEREARLTELRTTTGQSDAEVIALAESGELPSDPRYAEWLILLGHGGRIGRH